MLIKTSSILIKHHRVFYVCEYHARYVIPCPASRNCNIVGLSEMGTHFIGIDSRLDSPIMETGN